MCFNPPFLVHEAKNVRKWVYCLYSCFKSCVIIKVSKVDTFSEFWNIITFRVDGFEL